MGDDGSLAELYAIEAPGLRRVAFLLTGDAATAEDVVQESFARAASRWRRLSRYDKPGAWLRLVVVRLSVRARAARRREDGSTPELDRPHFDPPPPDPELTEALQRLSDAQRWCVVLHHVEGYPVAEVGQLLRMPEGTVRSHLHRGRAALAAQLTGGRHVDARD